MGSCVGCLSVSLSWEGDSCMSEKSDIFDDGLKLDPVEAKRKLGDCVSIIRQCAGSLPQPETAVKVSHSETETEDDVEKPTVRVKRSDFEHLTDLMKRPYDPSTLHCCDEQGHPIIGTKNRIKCVGRWKDAEKVNPVRVIFIEDENADAFAASPDEEIEEVAEPVRIEVPAGASSKAAAFVWLSLLVVFFGKGARRDFDDRKNELAKAITDYEVSTGRRMPMIAWITLLFAVLSDIHRVTNDNQEIKDRFAGAAAGRPNVSRESEMDAEATDLTGETFEVMPSVRMPS